MSKKDELAEARAQVARLEADRVIGDQDGHFPYRAVDAIRAGAPAERVAAAERVVLADEERRRNPSEATERAYLEAVFEARRISSEARPVPPTHEEHGVDADGFRVLRRIRDGALTATQPTTSAEGGER
ncbi:hypothetical protein AB0F72_09085 [Actinoplanes sp. NPDC023936]|uniref:hypothetical protein n=1 Tax=Actinoplanes sp. NPDC023936 TaxID=3154910 RepID=UPI0033C497EB